MYEHVIVMKLKCNGAMEITSCSHKNEMIVLEKCVFFVIFSIFKLINPEIMFDKIEEHALSKSGLVNAKSGE